MAEDKAEDRLATLKDIKALTKAYHSDMRAILKRLNEIDTKLKKLNEMCHVSNESK